MGSHKTTGWLRPGGSGPGSARRLDARAARRAFLDALADNALSSLHRAVFPLWQTAVSDMTGARQSPYVVDGQLTAPALGHVAGRLATEVSHWNRLAMSVREGELPLSSVAAKRALNEWLAQYALDGPAMEFVKCAAVQTMIAWATLSSFPRDTWAPGWNIDATHLRSDAFQPEADIESGLLHDPTRESLESFIERGRTVSMKRGSGLLRRLKRYARAIRRQGERLGLVPIPPPPDPDHIKWLARNTAGETANKIWEEREDLEGASAVSTAISRLKKRLRF